MTSDRALAVGHALYYEYRLGCPTADPSHRPKRGGSI
jgi:hypothetical protein